MYNSDYRSCLHACTGEGMLFLGYLHSLPFEVSRGSDYVEFTGQQKSNEEAIQHWSTCSCDAACPEMSESTTILLPFPCPSRAWIRCVQVTPKSSHSKRPVLVRLPLHVLERRKGERNGVVCVWGRR